MHYITHDDRGEVELGYFYTIKGAYNLEDNLKEYIGSIISTYKDEEWKYAYYELSDCKYEDRSYCNTNKDHYEYTHYSMMELDMSQGGEIGHIIPDLTGYNFTVRRDLNELLLKSSFTGYQSIECKVHFGGLSSPYGDERINPYFINFTDKCPLFLERVLPDSESNCPYCGESIFCPECNTISEYCQSCDKELLLSKKTSNDEIGYKFKYDNKPSVLDGSTWEGSDFMNCHIITGRVLDFLLKNSISQFVAWELRTKLDSCSKEQRKKLEKIKNKMNYTKHKRDED